jgi:holo-[acyl-carrier protein] synthase
MILGIGNDIIEIARIKAILARYPDRFLDRILTPYEQDYCLKRREPALHLAGRFAAKEAVVKALGVGFAQGLSWRDIEIRNDSKGKPIVFLSPFATELFGDLNILLSISHCHHYATAFAIWLRDSLSDELSG